jgi:hypothetical protein
MTLKEYSLWFKENWQKTGVIVGVFLTIYLVVLVRPENTVLFALLMSTPLYMLHQAEEYIFPGHFAEFLNRNVYRMDVETGLLDSPAVFWINMAVWFFLPLDSLNAITDLRQAAWIPYFFIFQAVIHLILGIVGKRFFNPGMVSAWLVHVPWGIWTIRLLVQAKVIVNPYWNEYLRGGLLIVLYMAVAACVLLIRRKLKHRSRQQLRKTEAVQ